MKDWASALESGSDIGIGLSRHISMLGSLLQVGGFLQRIDYVRKHAFAAMCILKDTTKGTFPIRYSISGLLNI